MNTSGNAFIVPAEETDKQILQISFDGTVPHEVSGEFSLPDYMPEIKRLLHVVTKVLPEGKFISGDESGCHVDFGGTVTYSVLYADERGCLCSASLSSDYESNTSIAAPVKTLSVDTRTENVSCRVTGPRDLSIKTRLRSRICAYHDQTMTEKIEGKKTIADELALERLVREGEGMRLFSGKLDDIHVSEKLPPEMCTGGQPVWCDAVVHIIDVRAQENGVDVRGEIAVKCICTTGTPDALPRAVTRKIPFEETVEVEGASPASQARAWGRCISLSIAADGGEESSDLFCDLIFALEAECAVKDSVMVTADMYSTAVPCRCDYHDTELLTPLKCANGNMTLAESLPRLEKNDAALIDLGASAVPEKLECGNGKLVVSGTVAVWAIYGQKKHEEDTSYELGCEEYAVPFRYETDASCAENLVWRCEVVPVEISGRADRDNLHLNTELAFSLCALGRHRVRTVDGAVLDHEHPYAGDGAGKITLYYPEPGDTLWSVGKRYHKSRRALADLNGQENSESTDPLLENMMMIL